MNYIYNKIHFIYFDNNVMNVRINEVIKNVKLLKEPGNEMEFRSELLWVVDPRHFDDITLFTFNLMITSVGSVKEYARDVLHLTDNVRVVEILLEAMRYTIPRHLNSCLYTIMNMEILHYILSHARARFIISYKTSEPLRVTVMNNDIERLVTFIQTSPLDVHSSGTSTLGKSSVELAVLFQYTDILTMFIELGVDCTRPRYSEVVNKYVRKLELLLCVNKIKILDEVVDSCIEIKKRHARKYSITSNDMTDLIRHYDITPTSQLNTIALLVSRMSSVIEHCV
jgi:hypothetical protein